MYVPINLPYENFMDGLLDCLCPPQLRQINLDVDLLDRLINRDTACHFPCLSTAFTPAHYSSRRLAPAKEASDGHFWKGMFWSGIPASSQGSAWQDGEGNQLLELSDNLEESLHISEDFCLYPGWLSSEIFLILLRCQQFLRTDHWMEKNQSLFFHHHKKSCKTITVRITAQVLHETLLLDIVGEGAITLWMLHMHSLSLNGVVFCLQELSTQHDQVT